MDKNKQLIRLKSNVLTVMQMDAMDPFSIFTEVHQGAPPVLPEPIHVDETAALDPYQVLKLHSTFFIGIYMMIFFRFRRGLVNWNLRNSCFYIVAGNTIAN